MKDKKNSGLSPLALVLIITTSIVAAVGIVFLVLKVISNKKQKELCSCDCCDLDGWDFSDEDILGDLDFDEEEVPEEISAAVDEAIEAISAVSEEE